MGRRRQSARLREALEEWRTLCRSRLHRWRRRSGFDGRSPPRRPAPSVITASVSGLLGYKDDRYRLGRRARRMRGRRTRAEDHRNLAANQIVRKFREAVVSAFRPEKFNRNVLVVDIAGLAQPVAESCDQIDVRLGRTGVKKSDDRHRWLLRMGRERACRGGPEKRDEFAPLHLAVPRALSGPRATANTSTLQSGGERESAAAIPRLAELPSRLTNA